MQLSIYELDDLAEEVRKLTGGDPLGMLTYANRTDSLMQMLAAIGLEGLLPGAGGEAAGPRRIVVLGDTRTGVGKLRAIAAAAGLDPDDFEFCLDYDRLKHYNFGKLRDRDNYRAVLYGPGPHSTPGKGTSSSAIEEMKEYPQIYPPLIEIRDRSGELKITTNSFRQAVLAVVAL